MRKLEPQQQQEPGFKLNLGEYFRVLWRKKYFLAIPIAIALVVANVGVRFLVPEYESSSLIRVGTSAGVSSEVDRFVQSRRSRDAELGTQLEADLMGNAFLDELIRQMGFDRDPDLLARAQLQAKNLGGALSTEELLLRRMRDFLRRRIKIKSEGPGLFRISYADADPEACYILAESITRLYIDIQRRQTMRGLREVSDFSEEQLEVYRERLERSERELDNFMEQIASKGLIANPVNERNVAASEKLRNDLDLTIRAAEATLQKIRARVGTLPDADQVWGDPELVKLINELVGRREAELLGELGDSERRPVSEFDPVLISQQTLQRRLMKLVEGYPEISADYRPLVVEYFYQQVEIRAYRQKLKKLDEYLRAFRSQIALAPQTDTELARLRQEVEHNRSLYNTFKSAQTTSQISEAAQDTELGATVFLLEAASKPVAPVRPDKVKILVLSFLFGLTVGGAGLLVTEFTDLSFRSVEEVERTLGVRVLGTVPRVGNTRWAHDSARRRNLIWVGVSVGVLLVSIGTFYYVGKSRREALIDLHVTRPTSATTSETTP